MGGLGLPAGHGTTPVTFFFVAFLFLTFNCMQYLYEETYLFHFISWHTLCSDISMSPIFSHPFI